MAATIRKLITGTTHKLKTVYRKLVKIQAYGLPLFLGEE
jgi:hypothetical protein